MVSKREWLSRERTRGVECAPTWPMRAHPNIVDLVIDPLPFAKTLATARDCSTNRTRLENAHGKRPRVVSWRLFLEAADNTRGAIVSRRGPDSPARPSRVSQARTPSVRGRLRIAYGGDRTGRLRSQRVPLDDHHDHGPRPTNESELETSQRFAGWNTRASFQPRLRRGPIAVQLEIHRSSARSNCLLRALRGRVSMP
jgi:hypothetical protein